ncbi:hypothetical protein [Corynebacterium freiburgense]|uniref:hypothetical protein n=1 Tax=Corynebacterium freiburgense TaxID=556548 RepID=UPI000415DA71|nr:hypothetical protein [Corynebacterium freiburgense]WJZ02215.1 hypothetical protein CFREI_04595 [Corynebacterium freiburgense]
MRKQFALALIGVIVLFAGIAGVGMFYFLSSTPDKPSLQPPIRGITLTSIEHLDTTISLLQASPEKTHSTDGDRR